MSERLGILAPGLWWRPELVATMSHLEHKATSVDVLFVHGQHYGHRHPPEPSDIDCNVPKVALTEVSEEFPRAYLKGSPLFPDRG